MCWWRKQLKNEIRSLCLHIKGIESISSIQQRLHLSLLFAGDQDEHLSEKSVERNTMNTVVVYKGSMRSSAEKKKEDGVNLMLFWNRNQGRD